ncbi:MAG TPA: ABC transporter ATP-binding protein [Phycisphaerales bacterium]|nr:ABC transporter ATP-binding protein [Phycisphaerales bacterium]HMP37494.1 ABC transporter ATP-binding protein [Phycisphaerales bacterium]
MHGFWRFARLMLRDRGALAAAIAFAFISAGGLGLGLVSIAPLLRMILEEDATLPGELARIGAERLGGWIPQEVFALLPAGRLEGVAVLLGALAALTLIGATANFLHEYLAATVSIRTTARVRAMAFRTAIHLPLRTVVRRGPAEFVAKIVRDAAELQRGFMVLTSRSVAQITKGIAAFAAAVVIEWRLTLVAIVVAPPMAILLRKIGKRIRRGTRGALEAQEALLRTTTESLQGLRAIKTSLAERDAEGRFRRANRAAMAGELRVRTARAIAGPLVESMAIIVVCGLALFAAREILAERLAFERFVLALVALGVSAASFKPVAALVGEIQAAEAPARRLEEIVDEPIEPRNRGLPRLPRASRSIGFERVRVRYPGATEDALRGVELAIPFGQWIAVVGPNGSGKTTLASLLPRLLLPDEGRVLIDGVDIAKVDLRSLRSQIAVVTQDVVLFRASIAENIAFGMVGLSRESIIGAARRAHADEFIRALPGGYDHVVAEHGASLSGGQRQRLSIARAIVRDPAILVLDEATSQIDPESERLLNATLAELRPGRTIVAIAHRVETMRAADRIIAMDRGVIVADGAHAELLEQSPLYRRISGETRDDPALPDAAAREMPISAPAR